MNFIKRIWMTGMLALLPVTAAQAEPAKVELHQDNGRWQLFVNNKPFFIKGAGLEGGDQEKLAAHGGNSLRTWSTRDGQEVLDRAAKNGLYVTMGLDMARERQGFDYSDSRAVQGQLAQIKAEVLQFKDHPALLMWDIGNELNLDAENPKVWDAVNDISKMIHRLDPNHLTTTSVAGMKKSMVDDIKARAPDLDLLSIQMYSDIVNLPERLRETGWTGPYAVTEWGASGHWEVGKTVWGAPIEDDSSVKANFYRLRYEKAIASDPRQCVGSYVFLWGQKQERTPTWYGMFLASGAETETVDVLQYLWTGHWPEFRSPELKNFSFTGRTARENIHVAPGQIYPASVVVKSPEDAPLTYSWEVMPESSAKTVGGDFEARPARLSGLISPAANGSVHVKAPAKPGAYRLFVYALDNHGKAAYANIPFYVDAKSATAASGHE